MARRLSTIAAERSQRARKHGRPARTSPIHARPAALERPTWQALLILWGIVGVVYANAHGNGFVFDDASLIVKVYSSREPWDFLSMLHDPWGNIQGRPLRNLTYDLDYSLAGLNPRIYHLFNIVFHALNTTLVYQLARRLPGGGWHAFVAAGLFAVHPIQTEAVTNIAGRKDLLATLFYLLAFSGFTRYCVLPHAGSLALILLPFLLGLLSKESAVTFPVACLLYEVIYQARPPEDRSALALARGAWQGLRAALSRHRLVYLSLFGMAAASSGYALLIVRESQRQAYWGGSLWLTLLTMARVFLHYLKLLILPTTLLADYSFDAFPITRSIADPASLLAVAGLAAIVWALLRLWSSLPTVTFGGLWWFLTLLPVSQLIPHHEMMAERFLYLPSVGVTLAAGALLDRACVSQRRRRLLYTGVAIVVVLLAVRTVIRNRDWKDQFTLLKKTVADAPRVFRSRVLLAATYQERGLHDEAERGYREALSLDPTSAKAHAGLASLFAARGDAARAEAEYLEALRLEPDSDLRVDLARFYEGRGALDQAEREYRQLLVHKPKDPLLRQNVAVFYHFVKRDRQRAEEEYLAALALRPREVEFSVGLGALHIESGELSKAEEVFRRGLAFNPTDGRLRTLLQKVEEVRRGQAMGRGREQAPPGLPHQR